MGAFLAKYPSVDKYPEYLTEYEYIKVSSGKYIKHMYIEEPRFAGGCYYSTYTRRSQYDFETQCKNADLEETQRKNIGLM
jgi:hypothetical protein